MRKQEWFGWLGEKPQWVEESAMAMVRGNMYTVQQWFRIFLDLGRILSFKLARKTR